MKLDFNKIVYLQIGGEIGKNNSLPLSYFAELAKNFQDLIDIIVKNDLSTDEAISRKNFNLELADFRAGSAVPGFRFSKEIQMTVGSDPISQRNQVSEKIENLMQLADTGKYLELKNLYPDNKRRNVIVKSLFNFVSSIKTPQASFVTYENDEIVPIYKVRKFKKNVRDSLIVKIIGKEKDEIKYTYGKVKITTTNGKERKTIKEIYKPEHTKITHVFELITVGNKIYQLTAPLMCTLEKDGTGFIIQSDMVGVVGGGESREEAIQEFCREFDFLYLKLKGLKYGQLTSKMKTYKSFFTILIESIV